MLRRSLLGVVVLALGPLAAPSQAGADPGKVWSFKADRGFIDDPVAFSGDDALFAFVHTDAAEFLTLTVIKTAGYSKQAELKLEDPTRVPKALAFVPGGGKLVMVWADGHSGAHSAGLYDLSSGKLLKKVGPATSAVFCDANGEPVVSLISTKADQKGGSQHSVTAYRLRDLSRVGAGSVAIQADQTLARPPLRLLYWEPGQLHLVGMMKGKYDKKRDIRLPDRAVRYSVLGRKEVWAEEPREVVEWTKATNMRPNHPGQYRFLQVSEDLKQLEYVDRQNALGHLTTPIKWGLYEPKSLVQAESWDGKTLYFSMTIDPVNADAVRKKKADKERMDLYRLDSGPKATPLGQVPTEKRRFHWTVGARHFAYLHKLKGFGRGGTQVELYQLPR